MNSEPLSEAPTAVPSPKLSATDKLDKNDLSDAFLRPKSNLGEDEKTSINQQNASIADESGDPQVELALMSTSRKLALLTIFSLAEFLDVFNNSALFPAIPIISSELRFEPSETVWIISAYQLTFAAFLLLVSIPRVYTDWKLRCNV